MKTITQIITQPNVLSMNMTSQQTPNSNENCVMRSLAKQTLDKLRSIYPAGYAALKTDEQKSGYSKELLLAFVNHNVNDQAMIDHAMNKARADSVNNPFLPAPNKFVSWCQPQPEDFGLLCTEEAYKRACIEAGKHYLARKWHDECVYRAASEIGFLRIASETMRECYKDFARVYEDVCQRYAKGERFTLPVSQQLQQKKPNILSKAENQARMGDLMNMFR